jgi:hypothetical protein
VCDAREIEDWEGKTMTGRPLMLADERRSALLGVRMKRDGMAALRQAAKRAGMSMGAFARMAIAEKITRGGPVTPAPEQAGPEQVDEF